MKGRKCGQLFRGITVGQLDASTAARLGPQELGAHNEQRGRRPLLLTPEKSAGDE